MTAEAQILRDLKMLKEKLSRIEQSLNKKEKDREVWVTANVLQKKYGVDYRRLEQLRKSQVIVFKQVRKGVVRYLLSSAENYFKNKTQAL